MLSVVSKNVDGTWFSAAVNENGDLAACSFSENDRREAEKSVMRELHGVSLKVENGASADSNWFRRLHEIYSGQGRAGLDSLDLSSVSEFKKRVYELLVLVPRGKVTTYGALAKALGSVQAARAVGTAMATNPIPLVIPCHRVVPSSLRVGNYGTPGRKPSEGAPVKRKLLEREGVRFVGDRVAKDCVLTELRVS